MSPLSDFSGILPLLIFGLSNINPSTSLENGGENVCSKLRSVKVLDVYPSNWSAEVWDCQSYFPEISCDRIRSGEVDIESVYFTRNEFTCCPGWMISDDKARCSEPCTTGYFGENCIFRCRCFNNPNSDNCDVIDGSCNNCSAGWTGRECDQSCGPGRYGPNCSQTSSFTCQNGGTNDPQTGECLCLSSYEGEKCEIKINEISVIQCQSCPGICDVSGNRCQCGDGFRGRYCSNICELGKGGALCDDDCCSGNGQCINEVCYCQDGYLGTNTTTTTTTNCQETCEGGKYGRNCQLQCACQSCHHVTGVCTICPHGFQGDSCNERCSFSQWGESCNMTCSCGESDQACDVFSGECPKTDSFSTSTLVVIIVVLGLLFIIMVGLCCFLKRHKRKIQNEGNQTALPDNNYSTISAPTEASRYTDINLATLERMSSPLTENEAYSRVETNTTNNLENTKDGNLLHGTDPQLLVPDDSYNTLGATSESSQYTDFYLVPFERMSPILTENRVYAQVDTKIRSDLQETQVGNHSHGTDLPLVSDGGYSTLGTRNESSPYTGLHMVPIERTSSALTENETYAQVGTKLTNHLQETKVSNPLYSTDTHSPPLIGTSSADHDLPHV